MIIDVVDPATGQRYIYIDDSDGVSWCDRPSPSRYTNRACRCFGCRRAHADYERRRRARRRGDAA